MNISQNGGEEIRQARGKSGGKKGKRLKSKPSGKGEKSIGRERRNHRTRAGRQSSSMGRNANHTRSTVRVAKRSASERHAHSSGDR